MDELDRMYRRLVQNIRSSFPEYLTRPFPVGELYSTLVPYRHNRRELELETNQDYELALMRLLSGERGYLTGDKQMEAELRAELDSPNPDLSKFRAYATTMVALAGDGMRAAEPPVLRHPGSGGGPAVTQSGGAPAPRSVAADRPTVGLGEPRSAPPADLRPAPPRDGFQPGTPPDDSLSIHVVPPAAPASRPQTVVGAGGQRSIVAAGPCRYCEGELPEGRTITFCPHCGQNLTVLNCPACGTELDVSWRFCTTCGRAVG